MVDPQFVFAFTFGGAAFMLDNRFESLPKHYCATM